MNPDDQIRVWFTDYIEETGLLDTRIREDGDQYVVEQLRLVGWIEVTRSINKEAAIRHKVFYDGKFLDEAKEREILRIINREEP